jgi:hypothetical protein
VGSGSRFEGSVVRGSRVRWFEVREAAAFERPERFEGLRRFGSLASAISQLE